MVALGMIQALSMMTVAQLPRHRKVLARPSGDNTCGVRTVVRGAFEGSDPVM